MTHNSQYAAVTSAGLNYLAEVLFVLSRAPAVVRILLSEEKGKVSLVLPESEARPESGEVAVAGFARGRLAQAEEGVALHGALPQVFAVFGTGQLEDEGVLLLTTLHKHLTAHRQPRGEGFSLKLLKYVNTNLLVVLHHHQRQASLFEIQPSDFWPE